MPAVTESCSLKRKGQHIPDLTRLPGSVLPKRYELKLEVDTQKQCYTGQVNIRIHIQNEVSSNTIWLNSKNLTITSVHIQLSQFALPVEANEVIEVPEKSCIGLNFPPAMLHRGTRAWLLISFSGKLSQSLEGFFCNPFYDKDGCLRMGAATMFAATECRSCKY